MKEQGKISFVAAVLMSINIIVGAGIYFNPQFMTQIAGSFSFLGWVLLGVVLFPVIWALAQAPQVFPGEGGFYHYGKTGINDTAGFLANWFYIFGYMGTAATYFLAIKKLLVSQAGLTFITDYSFIVSIALILILSCLNLIKIDLIAKIQSSAAIIKVLPLMFVIAIFMFYWSPNVHFATSDLMNLGLTMPAAIFGYFGFEACCSMGNLLQGGSKQVSRVIFMAFFISMVLYTLFHLGLIYIMGVENLSTVGAINFPQFLGFSPALTTAMQGLIAFFILFSVCNACYGVSSMNVENIFTLARKKLLFGSSFLVRTNASNRPTLAVITYALFLLFLVTFLPSLQVLMAFTSLGICGAFFLTIIALFLTFLKQKSYCKLFMTSLAFLSASVLIYYGWVQMGDDLSSRIINASPLIVGTIFGIVMFKIQQAKQTKTVTTR